MTALRTAPLLALAMLACAHAPEPARPTQVWPASPAAARVRWVGSFPDARLERDQRSRLARLFDLVLGVSERPQTQVLLQRPFGLAAVQGGFVVADPDARRVLRVDWRSGQMQEVACAGRSWVMPMAVAVDGDAIFVADGGTGSVARVEGGRCTELGKGLLERPTGVAIAGGRVYVVDPPRHAVVALDREGHEALRFGSHGSGQGELNFPTNVSARPDGTLLVVDALNFRIARYAPDGKFLGAFGRAGDGAGALGRPKAAVADAEGRTYVSDAGNDVVIVYSLSDAFELALGGRAEGPGKLTMPAGLALGDGLLFVADAFDHRVQVYELVPEAKP